MAATASKQMQDVEFLVLGGGPTGLGACRQLDKLGVHDWLLIEKQAEAGGLASSFLDDQGFTWDIGGHVQFSHYDYFDTAMHEFLGSDGWLTHERESWVWMRNRFIPYPFQNNIHRLPDADLNTCLQGLVEITKNPRPIPANFLDWIDAKFGPGIASVFLVPYNFKVWAYPPEDLSADWVGERVAVTDFARVLKNLVFKTDDYSWGPNNTFFFPKHGGTGAIWRAAAAQLAAQQLRFSESVESIDLASKVAVTNLGNAIRFDKLISTLALDTLAQISGQSQLVSLARTKLKFSSSHIFGIGLQGNPPEHLARKCWMYFPEDDCPFYRVTVFSNYSPFNVPDIRTHWSLMAEVSESPAKPVDRSRLWNDVTRGLINTRLIESEDHIVSKWSYTAPRGYPTPSLERDAAVEELNAFFESKDVYSRGRFGLWKYEVSNQDHAFMQGVEIVERLVNGRDEITGFDANYANSKKHPWPFDRWKEKQHAKDCYV